jgi:hypothetical protein
MISERRDERGRVLVVTFRPADIAVAWVCILFAVAALLWQFGHAPDEGINVRSVLFFVVLPPVLAFLILRRVVLVRKTWVSERLFRWRRFELEEPVTVRPEGGTLALYGPTGRRLFLFHREMLHGSQLERALREFFESP